MAQQKTQLLFHSDIFIPSGIQEAVTSIQKRIKKYKMSYHLREHIESPEYADWHHDYSKQDIWDAAYSLSKNTQQAFEVELESYYKDKELLWAVTKFCCRVPKDEDNDIVLAIRPSYLGKGKYNYSSPSLITTAWVNNKNDQHNTLRQENYSTEGDWLYYNNE